MFNIYKLDYLLTDVNVATGYTWYILLGISCFSIVFTWIMILDMCWIVFEVLNQFVIFNPWIVPWNWIAFYQNLFVISPGLLYHLIRRDSGWLVNETFTSNHIVSSKQWLNGLKITRILLDKGASHQRYHFCLEYVSSKTNKTHSYKLQFSSRL